MQKKFINLKTFLLQNPSKLEIIFIDTVTLSLAPTFTQLTYSYFHFDDWICFNQFGLFAVNDKNHFCWWIRTDSFNVLSNLNLICYHANNILFLTMSSHADISALICVISVSLYLLYVSGRIQLLNLDTLEQLLWLS